MDKKITSPNGEKQVIIIGDCNGEQKDIEESISSSAEELGVEYRVRIIETLADIGSLKDGELALAIIEGDLAIKSGGKKESNAGFGAVIDLANKGLSVKNMVVNVAPDSLGNGFKNEFKSLNIVSDMIGIQEAIHEILKGVGAPSPPPEPKEELEFNLETKDLLDRCVENGTENTVIICGGCCKVREGKKDETGMWHKVQDLNNDSAMEFEKLYEINLSNGLCNPCYEEKYKELEKLKA